MSLIKTDSFGTLSESILQTHVTVFHSSQKGLFQRRAHKIKKKIYYYPEVYVSIEIYIFNFPD